MKNKLTSYVRANTRLAKYFIMACFIVVIELGVFQLTYVLSNDYVLATIISFCVGVILNYALGRRFIFKKSHHSSSSEFIYIVIASLVGVGVQVIIVFLAVQIFSLYPLIGKGLSIIASFVWNYWFRVRFIYKHDKAQSEQ